MSSPATALKRNLRFIIPLLLAASPLAAQVPGSPIVFAQAAITSSFVSAPSIGGSGGGGSSGDNQWLKVEFHYSVVPPAGKFLDSVEFRIWVEGLDLYSPDDRSGQGVPVALTGSVNYVNLPATKDGYGVFYVSPWNIARFSSKRGSSDFDRTFDIHVEAYVNGSKVDYFDKNKEKDANWFQQLKPLSGFVCRQDQSPFIVSDPDRYPPIKLPPVFAQ